MGLPHWLGNEHPLKRQVYLASDLPVMKNISHYFLGACVAVMLTVSAGAAQGIDIKRGGVVLYGATANCSQPATISWKKVRKATPEWKTIQVDAVRKGSGRYDLLISAMNARIKQAAASAADAAGRDCIVRSGDVKASNGLEVADLTREVIAEI